MKNIDFCAHCGKEYEPNRRGAQKFCSNSCRSRSWQVKQKRNGLLTSGKKEELPKKNEPTASNKITAAGIGNAAIGTAAVDITKHIFTPEPKKNATKEDVRKLSSIIKGQRYFPVKNMALDSFGRKAFYDIETENVIYTFSKY